MKPFFTLAILFNAVAIFAQAPAIESQKILGGLNYDNATCVEQTSDGGYIVAGYSISTNGDVTGNNGDYDYWIVKLTSAYAIEWQKSLGGSDYDVATAIHQTSDGGYIVSGYTRSNDGSVAGNHGGFDYWIVKLSSAGDIIFQKSLGGTGQDFATSVQQTSDGGFIVAGYSDSNNGNVSANKGSYDYWIVKLGSTGTIVWQKTYGGSSMDIATSVKQTPDGGYIVAGYTDSNNVNVTGNHGGFDYWIIKVGSTGLLEWKKTYGGSGDDMANAVQTTTDGGYIVTGSYQIPDGTITGTHTNDYWVLKLNSIGDIQWQKSLGGKADDVANAVQTTADGGFIVAGASASSDGDADSAHKGVNDYWVLKLKSNGTLLWQKSLGGTYTDIAQSVQQTADGGYIIAGSSESGNGDVIGFHGTNSFINYDDYWIAKLSHDPDVIITADPGIKICNGTTVVFTATLGSSIVSPAFQWKKNAVNVGTNSDTYTDALLQTADSVICIVTSSGNTIPSNTLKITVNNNLTPLVSIAASPPGSVCKGTTIVFTATPINGGEVPVYQWKKNGINTGTNNAIYRDSLLNNSDSIWCVLTTSETCVTNTTATSNKFYAAIISKTPSIIITASNTSICPQETVTFTVAVVNGGASPVYQWKKNGNNVGTNSSTYSGTFNNNDSVWCVLTSNDNCLTTNGVKSNTVKITVNPNLVVSVNITSSIPSPICAGTSVTFTATAVNGGTAPVYHWKKNGLSVGTNSSTFTSASLQNDDTIYCVVTSNACTLNPNKTSNKIRFTVLPLVTPTISISANTGTSVCTGTKVTFTATITDGGTSPVYQWKKNGIIVGTNVRTYVDSTLATGDAVFCKLTSNASCVTTNPVSSNTLTMSVGTSTSPTITIVSNPPTPICQGILPTLTATITNGGASPVYQWKKNSVNVGSNSPTFTPASLNNNDTIWCVLTSSNLCASPLTLNSNKIRYTINPLVTPSITFTASTGTTICNGTKVTFTATAINGGGSPIYQWKKNSTNVGTNSRIYVDSTLKSLDTIYCILTSNASCVTSTTAQSSKLKFTVNPVVKPTIVVAADKSSPICSGTQVNFTATITNGGSTPVYQWRKNGVIVGTNSPSYSNSLLHNNDTVYCYLTSNAACPVPVSVISNKIRFTVNNVPANPSAITGPTSVTANQKGIYYSIADVLGVTETWTVPAGVTIVSGQGRDSIKVNWGTSSGTVSVVVSNTCGNAANGSSLNVSVGSLIAGANIKLPEQKRNYWKIYPNPTKGIANIYFTSMADQQYIVEISDAVGKILITQSGFAYKGQNNITVNLSTYTAGMYYIKYSDKEQGLQVSRIIKSD